MHRVKHQSKTSENVEPSYHERLTELYRGEPQDCVNDTVIIYAAFVTSLIFPIIAEVV